MWVCGLSKTTISHPCVIVGLVRHPEGLCYVVRVQSVTGSGVLISPSPLIPLPSRERGIGRFVLFTRVTLPPCGYCLKAQYDGQPMRERGTEVVLSLLFGHGQVMVL